MECVELNDKMLNAWTEFVDSSPDALLGHDIRWRNVVQNGLGHTPKYIVALEDDHIEAVLPFFEVKHRLLGNRLVSVPVLDQAGVLARSETAREFMYANVRELVNSKHYTYAQLRCKADSTGIEQTEKSVLFLDLPEDSKALWDSFKPKVRNQVRKAEKCGLTAEDGGVELVPEFYQVYSTNMRDLGVPALPLRLFTEAVREFHDIARVIIVRSGAEPVGGAVLMCYKGTAAVPWASSSRRHFDQCPNNLLYWKALSMGCDSGCKLFDFGRSTPDTGPYRFKLQWGAVSVPLEWDYLVSSGSGKPDFTTNNPKYRLLVKVWRRLPVPIANFLGPKISGQVA